MEAIKSTVPRDDYKAEPRADAAARKPPPKVVYTITERGSGKSFWTRIGAGFINRDGSMNLRLDAIPVNGTLQVRDWEPRDDRDASPSLARADRRDRTPTAELPF